MLQRDLKKIANESIFNPNDKKDIINQILLDSDNINYWVMKAKEDIEFACKLHTLGSEEWHWSLCRAIKLLILARAKAYE